MQGSIDASAREVFYKGKLLQHRFRRGDGTASSTSAATFQVVHALHPASSSLALLGAPVQCASYVQYVCKCKSSLSSIQPLDVHIDHKNLQ